MTFKFGGLQRMLSALSMLVLVVLLTQPASAAQEIPTMWTGLTGFDIPFTIDDAGGKFIEAQLYLSEDQGRNWKFYQSKPINADGFSFKCDGEGEYWFAMKTLSRDRELIPAGNVVVPEMKIIVDSTNPELEFQVRSDRSGRAIANWRVEDSNLDLSTVQISYRTQNQNDSQWQTLDFKPAQSPVGGIYVDQIAWWPKTSSQNLEIRFDIADRAGNQVHQLSNVRLTNAAIPRNNFSSTTWKKRERSQPVECVDGVCRIREGSTGQVKSGSNSRNNQPVPRNTFHQASSDFIRGSANKPGSAEASKNIVVNNSANGVLPDSIPWKSKVNRWIQKNEVHRSSTARSGQPATGKQNFQALTRNFDNVPVVDRLNPNGRIDQPAATDDPKVGPSSELFVTESSTMRRGKNNIPVTINHDPQQQSSQQWNEHQWHGEQNRSTAESTSQELRETPSHSAPPLPDDFVHQIPDRRSTFQPASGPSNPPAVPNHSRYDLGNEPVLKANSPRFNLNYDVRSIDPSGVGEVILWSTLDGGNTWNSLASDPDNQSPFPVQVPNEGTYGFKVVINSRDGLTGRPPKSGDAPDVWIDVDWTRPQAKITSVPYGSGKDIGKLIIHFSASDQNMALRPIKLLYRPGPNGPWTTIDEGLRNTGSYAWKVPRHVPEKIFLRIEARDSANNFGAYELDSPIDVSGLTPRGRIFGVESLEN